MRPSCRRASANLYVPVEQTTLLYKEVPETLRRASAPTSRLSQSSFSLDSAQTRNLPAGRMRSPA